MEKVEINTFEIYIQKQEFAEDCLIQLVGRYDVDTVEEEYQMLLNNAKKIPFHFVAVCVEAPFKECSPWKVELDNPKMQFMDGARKTLTFLQEKLIPFLDKEFENNKLKYILGGYSFLGLFALWAGYESNAFVGISGVSPSVWFPGWSEYIREKRVQAEFVYLSLGVKEKKTRNPHMRCIAENIKEQEQALVERIGRENCQLAWNSGNHFTEITKRKAWGFEWLLNRIYKV